MSLFKHGKVPGSRSKPGHDTGVNELPSHLYFGAYVYPDSKGFRVYIGAGLAGGGAQEQSIPGFRRRPGILLQCLSRLIARVTRGRATPRWN
jgi:hypothetical protein